jgi:hypothetical protein
VSLSLRSEVSGSATRVHRPNNDVVKELQELSGRDSSVMRITGASRRCPTCTLTLAFEKAVIMKTQLSLIAISTLALITIGVNTQHALAGQLRARHSVRHVFGQAHESVTHHQSYRYLYLNTEVNRHYKNEVVFAGRYLGADPDWHVRFNLRFDRPENR